MRFLKFTAAVIAAVLLICCFGGCGSKKDYALYYELDEAPDTLDPQLALGATDQMLVRNLYEGLVRADSDGKIQNAASEMQVSQDGLKYTFSIKDNMQWSNGEALTADDYLFAFERALDPSVGSPYASRLFCIKDAENYYNKKVSSFGVKAVDKNRIEITLSEKNSEFLNTLATAGCMPCNRNFYNKSKGQYGRDEDHVLTNGSFCLKTWNRDKKYSLRINKSKTYNGNFAAQANAVIFNSGTKQGRAERINSAKLDMGFVDYNEAENNENTIAFEKTCYALCINKNSDIGNIKFRKAFEHSIHRNRLKNDLSAAFSVTENFVLPVFEKQSKKLNSICSPTPAADYLPDTARELYLSAVKESGKPGKTSIIYYGSDDVKQLANYIAEGFQQALGIFVNTQAVKSNEELENLIKKGDYKFAITAFTALEKEPYDYFSLFSKNNPAGIVDFNNRKFEEALAKMKQAKTANDSAAAVTQASDCIMSDHSIIPLANYSEAFQYAKNLNMPVFTPFDGMLDLAEIRQK